jgi:hypothetical protein
MHLKWYVVGIVLIFENVWTLISLGAISLVHLTKLWRLDGRHTRPAARGPVEAHGGAWLAAARRGARAAGRLPELLLPAFMGRCCRWPPPRAPAAGHLHDLVLRGLLLFKASRSASLVSVGEMLFVLFFPCLSSACVLPTHWIASWKMPDFSI